ncbi:MAG: FAD-dependent oxidoreductase [Oscillospiraceae bacterium]|nr:FAD-dependent oxidoreductase [Oscillospiraceae bacterium]
MSKISLNINGIELTGLEGQTILDIARENGIAIPTLCHDERIGAYGACGICAVEVEGSPKLLRACSTMAGDGMVINTDTSRVRENRKAVLELLLSDHTGDCRAPCILACPAQTDCQGYAGLISNGMDEQALKLIMEKIPLPASIGRVCPHPCEDACRRKLVEEPIAIAALKRYAADKQLFSNGSYSDYTPPMASLADKKVAVIGGGPGGLSAAYFLRLKGYNADVYDAMPEMGGMLRYGIPEYRLPKNILSSEINAIRDMGCGGIRFYNNVKIGRDVTLDELKKSHNAVIIAIGAWSSTGLRCPGEELGGVLGGIDFLRDAALGKNLFIGGKVAVIGGGNTAMDACRTALRLGAKEVYNIYRRTKNEMPAEIIEIEEAEEEGVIFKNLTNPIEIIGENGKVKSIRLQIMKLGEPDSSGRRSPIADEGKEECLTVDTVIAAIGQRPMARGFECIEHTKWSTLVADEFTFCTSAEGVFAVGDAVNDGPGIAVTAIGQAAKAADAVDKYLKGEIITYQKPYFVTAEKTKEDFTEREKQVRIKNHCRPPGERGNDFLEINLTMSQQEAQEEASRCLECGCHDFFECKLIEYANQYAVRPEKYQGQVPCRSCVDSHPFINRSPDKCILCGMCVRMCDEVVGAAALGLVGRGFDSIIEPAIGLPLGETDCISCGQCVHACPTGALTETMMTEKQVPLKEEITETVCAFCSVGCKTNLAFKGGTLIRSLPTENGLLCVKGRFGIGETQRLEQIEQTENAEACASKRLQELQAKYGNDCIAVSISDRYTNEEVLFIKNYANKELNTNRVFSFSMTESGIAEVLGRDASTATFDELESTECIIAVTPDEIMHNHAVAGMKIRKAVKTGAELILLSDKESLLDPIAGTKADLAALPQVVKALMNEQIIDGYAQLKEALEGVTVSPEARAIAAQIQRSKRTVFIFPKNALTHDTARLIADMAVLSGHHAGEGNGILQLLPGANSQGLAHLGVQSGENIPEAIAKKEIRGLFIFGENVPWLDLSGLDFLAVRDLYMTETAKQAHIVLTEIPYFKKQGTFTAADGRTQGLKGIKGDRPAVPRIPGATESNGPVRLMPPRGTRLRRERYVCTNGLTHRFAERIQQPSAKKS